jgi:alanyl-tRNA synthetase
MESIPAYERDPYLTELETEVLEVGVEAGRPFAVLADTVLYPEGGGQPADRGTLGDIPVVDVQKHGGVTRHYLGRTALPGRVTVRLDWARRFDHMQQHTAQHLLTALANDAFSWPTTAFHLGELVSDVELDVSSFTSAEVEALEEAVAEHVRAARPVTSRRVDPATLATLDVRTRGLPADHRGDVRLVEIAGVDLNTCGGTHLGSTAEIEALALIGNEMMRGGTRLFFVAGGRLRRRLAAHEGRTARLRSLLGAPDAELAGAVEHRLEHERGLERQVRALEEDLSAAVAEGLASSPLAVVHGDFEGRDAAFLQRVARRLSGSEKVAFLTAGSGEQRFFVIVAGESLRLDVQAAGREVAAILGGRGGGSGQLFQGKAPTLSARDAALSRLQTLVGIR